MTITTALVMSGATMLFCKNILRWMNTPSNIEELAYEYLVVIFAGIVEMIARSLWQSCWFLALDLQQRVLPVLLPGGWRIPS